ncbi:DNA mismatch repair protein [Pleurotus pulmonarius]|nr:DNA mismatch repair protein [Pleurotus pulmonarius]
MTTEKLEPLPIKRLQEALINRIAAGEIIHRPASALKELIENCLDAGSTSIRITAKEGGMKLLQIQDNGCGIRKSDLPILAERFTTSKLSTFSDLSRIATYGFRGEALASISHVARLSVVTKTKSDSCAWRAVYADGALAPLKPGQSLDPKPCAGNDGTVITIEDLFYNTPTRLASLRSTAEEYSRILDVVTKYAIHNPHVSFSCKKAGSTSPDVTTPSGSEVKQTIQLLYGHSIANELMHVTAQKSDDDLQPWEADVLCSNANYQAKKTIFLLFINHRLVECSRMKRALEAVYSAILPKGTFPFIYLSLIVDPSSVDVNVHPTKREVHFLNEEVITERVCDAIQNELGKQSHSRTFQYQTLLTGGILSKERPTPADGDEDRGEGPSEGRNDPPTDSSTSKGARAKKIASQHKVRTSLTDRTLDSMFPVVNQATQPSPLLDAKVHDSPATQSPSPLKIRDIKESECYLTSVLNLRHALIKGKHKQLTEILEKHTFVGIVDLQRSLSLIQHSTKLYLVNNGALSEELFYQLGLRQFGDLSRMKLQPPPSLRSLLQIAVNAEPSTKQSKLTKDQIVDKIFGLLMSRREMLAEYFSLHISSSGSVESLPLLLRDYTPNLDKLPHFLMRLGPQVDWTSETECFDTFFRELAYFYIPGPLPLIGYQANDVDEGQVKAEQWQIQHVLFPAMRRYLCAPQSLLDRDVIQIANLPDLYRVFERC